MSFFKREQPKEIPSTTPTSEEEHSVENLAAKIPLLDSKAILKSFPEEYKDSNKRAFIKREFLAINDQFESFKKKGILNDDKLFELNFKDASDNEVDGMDKLRDFVSTYNDLFEKNSEVLRYEEIIREENQSPNSFTR